MVVEADAFKETDVIYRALSSRGHHDDMLQTAELVSEHFHVISITFSLKSPLLYEQHVTNGNKFKMDYKKKFT